MAYELVNAYDELVRKSVRGAMEQMDMCRCDKCYLDACAIVFNKGFVRFVTTPQGGVFATLLDMDPNRHVQLRLAVKDALEMIKDKPNH